MDILNTLKTKGKDLFAEELDFFVTELETGDYSDVYVKECLELITAIKNWQKSQCVKTKPKSKPHDFNEILLNPSDLIQDYKGPKKGVSSLEEQIKFEIEEMRKKTDYYAEFENYINSSTVLDENMISKLFKFFLPWELDIFLTSKSFSEDFLEKYFTDLEHSKIAKYQHFSEEFFMKHFNELSYSTVLQKGVNEWRKKANRSNKLNLFLRLKGVSI